MPKIPQLADIQSAARRIAEFAVVTPLLENSALNARAGGRVFIKPEVLQRTGSFKFRGALNRILEIPLNERQKGVVAYSSGNHAQGVAAAAEIFGIPAVIVMPADAPAAKIAGTRSYGAEIVFYDRLKDDRESIAARICEERSATLVKPFDDPFVVAGQGTMGFEIARAAADRGAALDAVLVPAGGGGAVSGIALAISATSPQTRIVSVEPENYDGMKRSLEVGTRTKAAGGALSVADALMAPMPGEIAFAIARERLAFGLSVSDEELMAGVAFAARHLKLIVEPGAAAALAAVLSRKFDAQGLTIAIVLTGGNCDIETIAAACAATEQS